MIFSKNLCSVLGLMALALAKEHMARDDMKLTAPSGTLASGIVNPTALQELQANITAYTVPANYGSASFNQVRPLYPGAVGIVGNQGTIVSHFNTGYSYKYTNSNGTQAPQSEWVALGKNDIFDMASLTKLFTTILTLQQLERGAFALSDTVVSHLPGFDVGGKAAVTVKMLLTHTSGFDADPNPGLWYGYPTVEERKQAVLKTAVINTPGKRYLYSDLSESYLCLWAAAHMCPAGTSPHELED